METGDTRINELKYEIEKSKKEKEEDMLALLEGGEDAEDKMIQMDISDKDLERVLDRCDLITAGHTKADGTLTSWRGVEATIHVLLPVKMSSS
ncbi:hypothetical protein Tco_0359720 [Tanacetum coccineum]